MSNKISPDELGDTIMKYLTEWREDIEEDVKTTANEIANEAKAELKTKSPVGARKQYRKGWSLKKTSYSSHYTVKIWNKTDYQLTHLLEFGHATANGGRTKAQPHIREVEEEYSKKFENQIKVIIGRKS